jgi:hypothetical protein
MGRLEACTASLGGQTNAFRKHANNVQKRILREVTGQYIRVISENRIFVSSMKRQWVFQEW